MQANEITFEHVFNLAQQLPARDQALLAARLAPAVEQALARIEGTANPAHASLRGLLAHLGTAPSAEEIDDARGQLWGNFPREDF